MATLKPTVKTKLKTGMYIVYIRVVQNRQSSFIRTSWMVNDKGVKGKEVTDPFVMQQVSNLISSYYSMLNKIDSSNDILITNERHKNQIRKAKENVDKAINTLEEGNPVDIITIYIQEAMDDIGEILGNNVTEDIINEIFKRFCLGK